MVGDWLLQVGTREVVVVVARRVAAPCCQVPMK